jgi:hypothetical protein
MTNRIYKLTVRILKYNQKKETPYIMDNEQLYWIHLLIDVPVVNSVDNNYYLPKHFQ